MDQPVRIRITVICIILGILVVLPAVPVEVLPLQFLQENAVLLWAVIQEDQYEFQLLCVGGLD